jgi:hypothetical protein
MITAIAQAQTKASASLLAQIRFNETWAGRTVEDAEALSLKVTGCSIDDLITEQAYQVLRAQAEARPPQQPHDGYCMSCDKSSILRQCMNCRDGQNGPTYKPHHQATV